MNGAQAKNIYWKVDGAILISNYSEFKGTIIANNGAVNFTSGVSLDGRIFTTTGALSTTAVTIVMPAGCSTMGIETLNVSQKAAIYPNPFDSELNIDMNDSFEIKEAQIIIYDLLGKEVKNATINQTTTIVETSNLTSGFYLYKIINNGKIIQVSKLLSK